MTSKA